jgi:TPR repeat protein
MLSAGRGGPQDTAGARELFDRTCKEGHVDSCVRLGNMPEKGRAGGPSQTPREPDNTHKPVPDKGERERSRH